MVKYQKLQTVHENTRFLILKPPGILFYEKTQMLCFFLYQYLFKYNIVYI